MFKFNATNGVVTFKRIVTHDKAFATLCSLMPQSSFLIVQSIHLSRLAIIRRLIEDVYSIELYDLFRNEQVDEYTTVIIE